MQWIAGSFAEQLFLIESFQLSNTDLLVVAAFCVSGLCASLAVMLLVPDFGQLAQALQQLP